MRVLGSFLGKLREPKKVYTDQGVLLTKRLIDLLELRDWKGGLPIYRYEETRAIDREMGDFQLMADKEIGGKAGFHPDAVQVVLRISAAQGLADLADQDWLVLDEADNLKVDHFPSDWKDRISTYLKAWASGLDPDVLIHLSQLLILAGYKGEAKDILGLVLSDFPAFAPRFFAEAGLSPAQVKLQVDAVSDRAWKVLRAV